MSKVHDTNVCTCPSGNGSLRWPCTVHPALLPCPFCGPSAAVQNESPADNSGGYFVACNSCGASTNLRYACGDGPVPLLVAQWNARAPQALPADALKPIRQAVRDYHYALDTRQHGGWAKGAALDAIETLLGMYWQQGEEASRRAEMRETTDDKGINP